jgi:hypothetical protein
MPNDYQDTMSHSYQCLLFAFPYHQASILSCQVTVLHLEAAHAASIKAAFNQGLPPLILPLFLLPPLSLFPGQTPAQEAK